MSLGVHFVHVLVCCTHSVGVGGYMVLCVGVWFSVGGLTVIWKGGWWLNGS